MNRLALLPMAVALAGGVAGCAPAKDANEVSKQGEKAEHVLREEDRQIEKDLHQLKRTAKGVEEQVTRAARGG